MRGEHGGHAGAASANRREASGVTKKRINRGRAVPPDDGDSRPYAFEDPEAEAAFGKKRVNRADWRTRRARRLYILGWFVRPVFRWFGVLALLLLWLTNQIGIGLFVLVVLTVVGLVAHAGLGSVWFRSTKRLQEDIEGRPSESLPLLARWAAVREARRKVGRLVERDGALLSLTTNTGTAANDAPAPAHVSGFPQ